MKRIRLKSGPIFVTALALIVLVIPLAHGRAKPAVPQTVSFFKQNP